ncbi:MAG: hydantoinase/oxoprolinase family protein, partial [Geminicoccaceae bacterium]
MWQFWIDRGGTFTDIVARAPDGMIRTHKLLSENPEQYKDAAVQGIRDLLGLAAQVSIPSGAIDSVKMGTTVATNALLERKGDRTLLLITKGLGDLLRIGYQNRPRLFDLHIKLPSMLYERVVEVEERVGAYGEVVTALDEPRAAEALQEAYDEGIRAVAIAFMHGYRYTDHEAKIASLAREIGFTQVSISHEVSPLMKLVSRGDTTVVDAYLSPILRRYVDQVASELQVDRAGGRLLFMQSSGGLTDARLFQGKDAILSGPAGGVVGMVETGRIAGVAKLIGFDMGGTSTDVTHFDGAFERAFETEVAGVRMRAPMMNIHTVAAGGGSILHFDGARYRVGPDSAGANPGPACYRRGGPLAVTDANVMLGKIQPQHFPEVFGPNASEPLDADIVHEKFEALASKIAKVDGAARTPQEVAEGFLRIAVENMANAIKKISVQRGYDVTEYTLNCFGGAGGQHACLVADALGMTKVLLHPFAGVLSAYGMGLADIRTIREAQIELPLVNEVIDDLADHFQALQKNAVAELLEQGIEEEKIEALRQVHLRYEGTHQPLLVDFRDAETMREAFDDAHKSRFGFAVADRKLVVESLSLEAIGKTEAAVEAEVGPADGGDLAPAENVSMWSEGAWRDVPLYDRADLATGHVIDGPAIIVEATSTNAIEAGWRAELNRFGHLILSRVQPRADREAVGTTVDPVMLEVFNNLFMSIAEQMGVTLANTAYSVNIKERLDFSCALFDSEGVLVANAPHVPVHLGSMSDSVRTIARLNEGKMKPGDVFMLNAPFNGGTHLPDVTVITPVFDENGENILFYVGSRGHHADIGGRTPGSAPPDSRHIE